MEIEALRLRISQEELNQALEAVDGRMEQVRGLHAVIVPGALHVRGEVDLLSLIAFDARIEPYATGGTLILQVAGLQAAGLLPLPASVRAFILSKVQAKLFEQHRSWMSVREDAVVINLQGLLESKGIFITANFTGVRCEEGALVLESQKG